MSLFQQPANPNDVMIPDKAWYRLSPAEVFEQLGSNADVGLSAGEANRRLSEGGANELHGAVDFSGAAGSEKLHNLNN
jgi:hypothetical protein